MKKILSIATILTLLLSSMGLEAQIYKSGGIGGHGTRTSYGSRSGGGGSGETKIFLGGVGIMKNNLTYDSAISEGEETLKIAIKYFVGATIKDILVTANFELAISSSDVAAVSTRYYAEAAYPVLGSFNGRFAIAGYVGAGINSLEAGSSYDFDNDEFVDNEQESALYAPVGAYVNLNILSWYGFRFGYQFAYNASDYAEKAFSAEGFMFGGFYRF